MDFGNYECIREVQKFPICLSNQETQVLTLDG